MDKKHEKDFVSWGNYLDKDVEDLTPYQEKQENDIELVEGEIIKRNKVRSLMKKGVNNTVGAVTNVCGKAYDSVTNLLDRIMNSSDIANGEVLDLFKNTIKGHQKTIEVEQAKDNPNSEVIKNAQDSIDRIVKETSVKHDKVLSHNEKILTVTLGAVIVITTKGFELLLESRNKKS